MIVREEEIYETPKKGNCKIFTIENGCFFNYKNFTKVICPSSLKEIGDYAFYGTAITKIVIPKNVTTIGSYAFANSDITYCKVLNDNAIIGNGCLANCKNKKIVYLFVIIRLLLQSFSFDTKRLSLRYCYFSLGVSTLI
jgi:hypothetical protein